MSDDEREGAYVALVNHEEQYSIWPSNREPPMGWREAGKCGTKSVLAWIKEVWTDMHPPSPHGKMDQGGDAA